MQNVQTAGGRWWTGNRALYGLLLFALILRGGVIVYLGDHALEFSSDAKAYQDIAVNLVEQGRFITTIDPPHTYNKAYATRPPFTPWLLAGVYELFGPKLIFGQLLLALVGVAACFILYRLGSALFNPTVGFWACLLAAVNPFWALLAAVPMTESVAILLYPLLALCFLQLLRAPSLRNAVLAGLVFAATALNKAPILGFVPFFLIWLFAALAPNWRRSLLIGGTTIAVTFVVLAPWTVRNYHLLGKVVPVTVQAGWSMYEANNPYTDYALRRVEAGQTWRNDPRIHESLAPLAGLSTLEFDAKLRELAFEFIREHPSQFVGYAWRRLRVFWGAYDHPAHRAFWYVIGPLFVMGFVLAWKTHFRAWRELALPSLLILQAVSLVVLFASMPRYRIPIEPFVLLFAGYGLQAGLVSGKAALSRVRSRSTRTSNDASEESL